jgi:serine protease Do
MLAAFLSAAASVTGASHGVGQPPASSESGTLFRDIARRENPVVVSVIARSRLKGWKDGGPGEQVNLAVGSGFVISSTGDILTNRHVVEGAERIEVTMFGNDRKRYRAIRVGSDPLTDSALIRLQNPPPNLQQATLGDSSVLEPGDWVVAIGSPFELGHSVSVGVVSFARRPIQVEDGLWQELIQTDASINFGHSGGPLFNARGEVVGINVAMLDADTGTNVGIGFAVPINAVKALLPQLRSGKVVRGQLRVQLHSGPILEDEATELRLPTPTGAIVMSVDDGSAAERAGLQAGDVIVEIDGAAIADTRDLIARTASTAPGTTVKVKIFREGKKLTRTVVIEEQPVESIDDVTADEPNGNDDGLTLGEITPSSATHEAAAAVGGALVVHVAPDSPADEAELAAGDIVLAINGRPVHTSAELRRELQAIERGRPVFLLVSRHGTRLFLEMRNN